MSEIFKVNEYHKGDYKFTEEGNLKDSKKEGLWKTYIHFEIETHIIGVDYDPENSKIINSGKYGKSLFKEETFLNGELHGLYKTYQWNVEGNWVIDEGFYENGRKTGEWISHGKWNDRFVCNYKNGKKHGSFKGYQQGWVTPKEHSTDIITSEGTYKDGELHGNYKSYHFEKYKSLLYKDLNYKNGKLHGYCITYRLYPDPGKIEDEGMYKNGEKTGKWIYYYKWDNKCVDRICEYDHNEGKYPLKDTQFRTDGKTIFSISHWKGRKLHGLRKMYDHDGKLCKEETYKEGELIDSKRY